MTIFRSKKLTPSGVTFHDTSSSDPDAIGVEIQSSGEVVFDVMKERAGATTVCFGAAPRGHSGWEIEVADFAQMVERALSSIRDLEAHLRQPGEIWSDADTQDAAK